MQSRLAPSIDLGFKEQLSSNCSSRILNGFHKGFMMDL